MEITRRENLAVESIRAERFGPDPLLRDAVVRGRATLDGPLVPGRPSGEAGQACGGDAVWCAAAHGAADCFEFAPRDAEAPGVVWPDAPTGVDLALTTEPAGLPSPGGFGLGELLDVWA